MEMVFLVILLVVVVIILFRAGSRSNEGPASSRSMDDVVSAIEQLNKEIQSLKYKIDDGNRELKQRIDGLHGTAPATGYSRWQQAAPEPQPAAYEAPAPAEEIIVAEELPEETALEPAYEEAPQPEVVMPEREPVSQPVLSFSEPHEQAKDGRQLQDEESTVDKWMRNNPDLEKFIGENLINKIGIAILVLGIAFFVKYAIDKEWINEVGRVCIGMGCGALLIGAAHYLRKGYRSFSSVLAGGGIAVFYFTIAFAFHQYHLMPQAGAFVSMVVITAFAIALSVLYDKLELAIIATVGGFITPFLLSTGEGNYMVLFTYLIILDAGVLLLAYFKRWPAINIIALVFTELIFGGWLTKALMDTAKPFNHLAALGFASAFYFIFLGMNMVNQMKNKASFRPFDFGILLLISSSYFAAGISLLHGVNAGMYEGVFTLGMGMVNLALAYYVYKNGKADRNLLFLLIGITLTFITLTIPIQLHGHAITLFWSAEFVLLYWLAGYSGIKLFRYSSLLICALTLVSLFMDWQQAGNVQPSGLMVIYNNIQGIVTNLVAIAAFALWGYLLYSSNDEEGIEGVSNRSMAKFAVTVAVALLYITCMFGVNLYFRSSTASYAIPNVYHRMITLVFALTLITLMGRGKLRLSAWLQLAAMAVCFVYFLGSQGEVNELRGMVLAGKAAWGHFYMQWVDTLLLGTLFYLVIQNIRKQPEEFAASEKALSIIITLLLLTFLSMELLHIYVIAGYHSYSVARLEEQYSKAGLTVIWALSSFVLMLLGMKHRKKTLRIISLVLFSVVLLKLFLMDISEISEGGKILAFILLGVLLLTVSLLYQKLKKIITDEEKV